MVVFVLLQLYINYKHGMVISPFYHYGMYSEPMPVEPAYQSYLITVNGQTLQGKNFTAQQWDKIYQPIIYYHNIDSSNRLYTQQVMRIMDKVNTKVKPDRFLQSVAAGRFCQWYTKYLESVLQKKINQISIEEIHLTFSSGHLHATDSSTFSLCN